MKEKRPSLKDRVRAEIEYRKCVVLDKLLFPIDWVFENVLGDKGTVADPRSYSSFYSRFNRDK